MFSGRVRVWQQESTQAAGRLNLLSLLVLALSALCLLLWAVPLPADEVFPEVHNEPLKLRVVVGSRNRLLTNALLKLRAGYTERDLQLGLWTAEVQTNERGEATIPRTLANLPLLTIDGKQLAFCEKGAEKRVYLVAQIREQGMTSLNTCGLAREEDEPGVFTIFVSRKTGSSKLEDKHEKKSEKKEAKAEAKAAQSGNYKADDEQAIFELPAPREENEAAQHKAETKHEAVPELGTKATTEEKAAEANRISDSSTVPPIVRAKFESKEPAPEVEAREREETIESAQSTVLMLASRSFPKPPVKTTKRLSRLGLLPRISTKRDAAPAEKADDKTAAKPETKPDAKVEAKPSVALNPPAKTTTPPNTNGKQPAALQKPAPAEEKKSATAPDKKSAPTKSKSTPKTTPPAKTDTKPAAKPDPKSASKPAAATPEQKSTPAQEKKAAATPGKKQQAQQDKKPETKQEKQPATQADKKPVAASEKKPAATTEKKSSAQPEKKGAMPQSAKPEAKGAPQKQPATPQKQSAAPVATEKEKPKAGKP